jgi:hypothetical protein
MVQPGKPPAGSKPGNGTRGPAAKKPSPPKPPPVPREVAGARTVFDEPAPAPPKPKPQGRTAARGTSNTRRAPLDPEPLPPGPLMDPHARKGPAVRKPPAGGIHSAGTAVDPEDLKPAAAPDPDAVALEPVEKPPARKRTPAEDSSEFRPAPGSMAEIGPPLVAPEREADAPAASPAAEFPSAPASPPAEGAPATEGEAGAEAPPAGTPPLEFRGSGLGVFPLKLARLACAAGGAAGMLYGAALFLSTLLIEIPELPAGIPAERASAALAELRRAPEILPPEFRELPYLPYPILGAGAVLGLLALLFHRSLRRYRWSRTFVLGEPISVHTGLGSDLVFAAAAAIVILGTAGLATPWVLAWGRRHFLQNCLVKARKREKKLDFSGGGGEAFLLLLMGAASVLMAPVTLGVWIAWLRFRWARWELSGLMVPSPTGHGMLNARFSGKAGPFIAREALAAALRLATCGLFGPWATSARWAWIARAAEFPPEEERKKGSRRLRRDRDE